MQNLSLVREYCHRNFVAEGMCVDFAIHDNKNGNPHAHILLTMRPLKEDKSWGAKEKKDYALDENGERIPLIDKKTGLQKVDSRNRKQWKRVYVQSNDWNNLANAEIWRESWADMCNDYLEKYQHTERIDHRSYKRQNIEQLPTVHMGVAASQMEQKGILTERGNQNRGIANLNRELKQLRARIVKLNNWIKTESTNTTPPTLHDVIKNILAQKAQNGKSERYQRIGNIKSAAKILVFLQNNNISDIADLENKIKSMYSNQAAIREKTKPIERRLKTLDEHIKQVDYYFEFRKIYQQYKNQKPKHQESFRESHRREITLYESAKRYLDGVMNGRSNIPLKEWRAEHDSLTGEKNMLYREYCLLKEEVRKVEQIRRSVGDIMRSENMAERNRDWQL
jgi:hypothetical protein